MASELNVGGITTTGKIGVGAAAGNGWLHVNIAGDNEWAGRFENSDADNGYGMLISAGDDSNVKILDCRDLAGNSKLVVDGAGLATFSNGIAFQSATTGTGTGTGYTLDSYEEGTWTGTLTAATTAPTSAVTETGTYTKIGNLVRVQVYFAAVDTTGAAGSMRVTGLPFATITGNTYRHGGGDCVTNGLSIPAKTFSVISSSASTEVGFYSANDDAGWVDVLITAGASKYMRFAFTYLTD